MIQFRDSGGTLRTVTEIKFRDGGNVLRTVSSIAFRDAGNVLRTMAGVGGMTVEASPTDVYGSAYSAGPTFITTTYTGVTVTGGTPPYTYLWQAVDPGWDAVAPTNPTTFFRSPGIAAGDSANTQFTCTVTDTNGNTADSNYVTANCSNYYNP